ncbi:MAG TPA: nuclear transport factor 2 family protein, partial [Steroidobacteraceae bacterium]|nr:nuclear transport factor 2 family protein [Steroidobacteraceae bacterium]
MTHLSASEAAAFAQRWLPAWTGNDPERLAAFYSDDALYIDPGIPAGVRGKAELLANNPRWVWTQLEAIPVDGGFLNKWLAKIPVGAQTLEIVGVCL